jgi:hypothetical protein
VVAFAAMARRIGTVARAAGLAVPAFRTPPRRPGAARTIRRLPGGPVVSVAVAGRSIPDIEADLIEGVVLANGLAGAGAERARATLLRAVAADRACSPAA